MNQITQTSRPQYNSVATGTDMSQHKQIQTLTPHKYNVGVNTNYSQHKQIQTDQIQYRDYGTNMTSSIMGTQTPQLRSQFAREIAAMPMDT